VGLNPRSAWWFLPKASAVVFASFLAADSVNAVIAATLTLPETDPSASRSAKPVFQASRSLDYFLDPIVRRNVFRHGEAIPGEETAAEPLTDQPEEGCTLPIQVLASVTVPRAPHLSLATLLDTAAKRIFVVQVGERVLDLATLVSVEEPYDETTMRKDSIAVLERDDGSRFLCRSDDAPAPPVARGGAIPAVAAGNGVRRVAEGQYEIPQAEVDAVMNGGLATVATTVRIVPFFEGGKSAGFKLYSVKAGSLLSKLGLVNGDILRKVNGYEISSPEKALEVYGILKSERNVTLDVTRGGKPRTFQYAIR
jgi:general secretion pathway protein C